MRDWIDTTLKQPGFSSVSESLLTQSFAITRTFTGWYPGLFALMFLWMALAMIPLLPQVPTTGLDPSWAYALNLAHAQNLIFGRDVIFTFGPLGYLFYPVPGLAAPFPAFALGWAVHALFLLGAFLIWRALGNRLTVFISWAILSMAMLLTDLPFERMQLAFLSLAIGIVALLAARGSAGTIYLAIAGIVAGMMPLFKANEGIAACAVFYALLPALFLNSPKDRGRAWRLALVPPAAFVLGFVLVERNVSSLWAYMTRTLQIAGGYSEAMAYVGPAYQVLLAIFSLVALAFLIPLFADCRRDLIKGFLPAVIAAFLAFKSGLVRQDDWHADLLQVKLAVAGLFLLVCVTHLRDRRLLITYVTASFCFGASIFSQAFPSYPQGAEHRAFLPNIFADLSANWHFLSTWEELHARSRKQLDTLRLDSTVSSLVSAGTVDDVPSELDIVPANGWRWDPRPVFQSYSAYTPALDQLNASHLASRESADHILMQWDVVDVRQPLLDDAASWRSLFDHYDVELTRPDLLVLKRRDSPRYSDPRPIGSSLGAWHSDIAVPPSAPGGFNMMRVEIRKNLWGSLRGILYRNSPTYLTATYNSGRRQTHWRVTRANLADGAFIGFLPEKLTDTLPYFGRTGNGPPDRVVSIRFETPGLLEFSSAIRISWYAVDFRPGEAGPQPASASPEALSHLLKGETKGYIDDIDGRSLATGMANAASNQSLTVSGWAVDAPAHRPASAVYFDLDGHLFSTFYGSERHDVAGALKEPAYGNSGFRGQIYGAPGSHKVSIRIVNADGTGYYAGPVFQLNLK
jgi:hypothetical protein